MEITLGSKQRFPATKKQIEYMEALSQKLDYSIYETVSKSAVCQRLTVSQASEAIECLIQGVKVIIYR